MSPLAYCTLWFVADGSNFKNYIDQWKKTCESNGIQFYDTSKEGAFILNL
ncbi:MAG: hypothetical protein ACJ0PZ_04020 [Flavobacteriaceae bacterium]|tara:strand:- start:1228 stop:1377 length:150 start_codon:yes stop_codon:yes gene_type:complete